MKAKYFFAESREAAEASALVYFGCGKENMTLEPVAGKEEPGRCQLLAMVGSPEEVANMDAHYCLYYENDGVYLELYKERGAGYPLESESLMHHLARKKIENIDTSAVRALIKQATGRVKIARVQKEYIYGEDFIVTITADELQANAVLLAPEPGGVQLDLDTAKKRLRDAGVTHGISEDLLAVLLKTKDYGNSMVVANATPPKAGDDGKLIFNFSTDEKTGSPREIECGRVDYKSLDLYVPVVEGQLLVTRTPATGGHPGQTVRGKEIKQKPGKEITFPRGKNVSINDNKTEMHALYSGMVEVVKNSVNVSRVYNIKGDCDLSVGNIDFDGSVHISGSVRSGHTVKATGGVVVGGSVEAATIIAGGNVEVKGGMQGADKGIIEAAGSVSISFVERGTVQADGPVTLDMSLHSYIESGDTLTARGKRGAIIGGRAGSYGSITANIIGGNSNTRTEVAVGVTPRKRARLKFLEKDIERLKREQTKLERQEMYLVKSQGSMNPESWGILRRSCTEIRRQNAEILKDYQAEEKNLRYDLKHATEGKVHVFETVFSGSRVLIGSDIYNANDEINYVSFRYDDGHIVYGPCELGKAGAMQ